MARPLRLELAGGFYHVTSRGDRREDIFFIQHANRTHGRVGHVFQGRYKAILVEKEAYLLELARYVVLNPVRARMVADAAEWPWSSYRCMTGEAPTPSWLQTDALLGRFGLQRDQAVMRFIDFVRAGVDQPPLWDKLKGQIYLDDDAFLEKMSALANDTIQETH